MCVQVPWASIEPGDLVRTTIEGARDGKPFPVAAEFWVRRSEPWHKLSREHGRVLLAEATVPSMSGVAEPEDGLAELLLKASQRGPGSLTVEGWTAIRPDDDLHYIRDGQGLCHLGAIGHGLAFRPFPWGIVDDWVRPCPNCLQALVDPAQRHSH